MSRNSNVAKAALGASLLLLPALALPVAAQEPPAGPEPAVSSAAEVPGSVAPTDPDAPPVTLMFSLKDLIAIQAAIREGGLWRDESVTVETIKPRLRDPLYLSGILYAGPGDWTIWINGQPLRPGDKGNMFEVIEVTGRHIVLLVAWGESTRQVVLEPNQTFLPAYAAVVEGRTDG